MVPEYLVNELSGYFPQGLPWGGINLTFRNLDDIDRNPLAYRQVPASRLPRGLMEVSRTFARGLRTMGATIGRQVFLNPQARDMDDAASQSLAAHEFVHVWQWETIPNFDELYAQAQEGVPEDQPWLNPFEWDAYMLECHVYRDKLAQGYPPGDWVPLGITQGIC